MSTATPQINAGTSTDDLIVKKDVATQTESGHDTWDGNSDDTVLYDVEGVVQHDEDCDSSEGSYIDVYELDPDYIGSPYHSQPAMGGIHGASYTPPGWKHTYVKRRKLMGDAEGEEDEEAYNEC